MAEDIEIRIKVDDHGVAKILSDIDEELGNVTKSANDADKSFSSFQSTIITFNQGLELAGRAFGALKTAASAMFEALDEAAKIEGLSAGFQNLQNSIGNLASDKMASLRTATQGLVTDLDLMQSANSAVLLGIDDGSGKFEELAAAAVKLGRTVGIDSKEAMDSLIAALGRGSTEMLDNLGVQLKVTEAHEKYADQLDKTVKQLTADEKAQAFRAVAMEKVIEKSKELAETDDTAAIAAAKLTTTTDNLKTEFLLAFSAGNTLSDGLGDVDAAMKDVDAAQLGADIAVLAGKVISLAADVLPLVIEKFKDFTRGLSILAGKVISLAADVLPLVIEKFKDFTRGLSILADMAMQVANRQLPSYEQAVQNVAEATALAAQKTKEHAEAQVSAETVISNAKINADELAKAFDNTARSVEQATNNIRQMTVEAPKLLKVSREMAESQKNIKGSSSGGSGWGGSAWSDAFGSGSSLWSDLFNTAVDGAEKTADADTKAGQREAMKEMNIKANEIVGAIAGAVLTWWAGGIGAPIGAALGKLLGKVDNKIGLMSVVLDAFFGEEVGHTARKEVSKYFAEAFQAEPIMAIIDGELVKIKELVMDHKQFGPGQAEWNIFEGMEQSAKESFFGVGMAFEELLGVGDVISNQIAAMFANNVGGSLNNLQLLVKSTGVSFEELKKGVVGAFEEGKVSATEAWNALRGIEQVAQDGIPDGLGMVSEAFDNLFEAGAKGGAATVDALQDIGYEAEELGLNTLQEVIKHLEETGKYSSEQIQAVFDALEAHGIDSIEELIAATAEDLIPILAELETKDILPVNEAIEGVRDLVEEVNSMPDRIEKKLVFNIETRADQNTQEYKDVISQGGYEAPGQ